MKWYLTTQEREVSLEEIKKWAMFQKDLKIIQGKTSFVIGTESAEAIKEIREYVSQKLSAGVDGE